MTGVTGRVAGPLAAALAADNEVYGAARFNDPQATARLEAAGVRCVRADLSTGDVGGLPADADWCCTSPCPRPTTGTPTSW